MHVAVCALTYHRPEGLASLLAALSRVCLPEGVTVSVVVVDNDPFGSGGPIVEEARGDLNLPLVYQVETRRGIAQARNAAVRAALSSGADLVAFIDDDEMPDPQWLLELLKVHEAAQADVVTGPVIPVFSETPPEWVEKGAFYDRPRFPTGARLTYARTSNVLIASHLLREPWPPFDERYGTTGGEDTHFFMRVRLGGARIVWADDAAVRETVPQSRVSVRWLVRRAYSRGNTLSLCLRDLQDSWPRRAKRVAAAVVEVLRGVGLLVASAFRGKATRVAGLQRVAYGAGLASGLVGSAYEEYSRTHGR